MYEPLIAAIETLNSNGDIEALGRLLSEIAELIDTFPHLDECHTVPSELAGFGIWVGGMLGTDITQIPIPRATDAKTRVTEVTRMIQHYRGLHSRGQSKEIPWGAASMLVPLLELCQNRASNAEYEDRRQLDEVVHPILNFLILNGPRVENPDTFDPRRN